MTIFQNNFSKFHLPVILWVGFILVASFFPRLSLPDLGIGREDLIFHFILYLILGFLFLRSLNNSSYTAFKIYLVLLLGILFGTFCEAGQKFVSGRYFEVWDLFSNWSGILISLFFFRIVNK